ncbi:MAG: ABC transporter permease [Bacteroidetes bacterium]|nr:MAG: ABC transporter permease [Bacteroidota bacterium]
MVELFISGRIIKNNKGFSKPIVNIAILGITLGLAIMILTVAIVTGFQKDIREKVIGFGSHIQITNYDNNQSFEGTPIDRKQSFLAELNNHQSIRHIQCFATKAGIIKTKNKGLNKESELQGVVVKGVGSDFDWDFFKKNIIEGESFTVQDSVKSDKILISKFHAEKLKLKLQDTIIIYFIQNQQQRARRFSVCGIYSTGLGDIFDQVYVIADIAHIQKLNNWDTKSVGGFEILLNDYKKLDQTTEAVNMVIGYQFLAQSIKELNRQVFSWLDAQDINAVIVLALLALVAAINMISALLILILEKTNLIGTLKSLGMANAGVRKIFLFSAAYLIGRGLLWGNIAGISICLLQKQFKFISLDEATYYLSSIPINFNLLHILLLNVGTFLLCLVMLILPSYIITYITPVKAMRFS